MDEASGIDEQIIDTDYWLCILVDTFKQNSARYCIYFIDNLLLSEFS
jgi:hypothetical protein